MTSRLLPREEWHRLTDTDIPSIVPYADDAQVVVVERGDRIVGAWAVLRVVHLEGVWIAPEYRGRGTVAARLLRAGLDAARSWGRWAFTGSQTPEVARLITRHLRGVRIPMDTYAISLEAPCR